jgi:DNA-binding SARP family transcriptional activator/tetratricopeptide (TPR) repeat protein
VRFGVLGPVEIRDAGGRSLALGGPQQRSLLAVLLLNSNRVVSVDQLVVHLWGGRPPATARALVQGCVAELRRALRTASARDRLRTEPPGYHLTTRPGELDLHRFEELSRAAGAAGAAGTPAGLERAAAVLAEALSLWRGPALDGVHLDSLRGEVTRLEERRLAVLERRIDIDLRRGRQSDLIGELEVLVKADPLRERWWAQLMLALYRADRRADALDAFHRLRQTLVTQLGVEPDTTVQRVHRAILAGDDALTDYLRAHGVRPAAAPGPPAGARPPGRHPGLAVAGPEPPLLERERELAGLARALREAADGAGGLVFIHGEAGIGKSSLVHALRRRLPPQARLLIGRCDDLRTPRTLGPLRDLAGDVGAELARALAGDDRDAILAAMRTELHRTGHPTVLVVEDVHWADEATVDVMRYLSRRIADVPVLLVLTYRDEDLGREHPLRHLLGQAAGTPRLRRFPLRRLSERAVHELAAAGPLDARRLFELTDGNPFFVTELLAAGADERVPSTVVDAVLSRVRRLDPRTQHALEQLAMVPSAVERWLVEALLPPGLDVLLEAEERGLLAVAPLSVTFRHELVRDAIRGAVPVARQVELNRRVLLALLDHDGVDLSRILHHAARAGDVDVIVDYGPTAAREAAVAGAHREAAAHYRLVLRHRDRFPPDDLVGLLEAYAVECSTTGAAQEAVDAQVDAVALRRAGGGPGPLGAALRALSRMHWRNGDHRASARTVAEAVAVLEHTGDTRRLAAALAHQAGVYMVSDSYADSVRVGERAIALARRAGDAVALAEALCSVGVARWLLGEEAGRAELEESLRVAESAGAVETALRTHTNFTWELLDRFLLADAARHLAAARPLAERAQHVYYATFLDLLQARVLLAEGSLTKAIAAARRLLEAGPGERCQALIVMGRAKVRRGEPGGEQALERAWRLARELDALQHRAPVAAARAEAAWLRGDPAGVPAALTPVLDDVRHRGVFPVQAEFAYWLTKTGQSEAPVLADDPYGLLVAGRWREAARFWHAAGCRYEYATALAESPDPEDRRRAVAELTALGATPLARRLVPAR